jgi:hypothetical protein
MNLTINRTERDALYDSLVTDLSAVGDISIDLDNDEPAHAKRLRRRFEVELRLLDDLGWEKKPDREQFELTMPAAQLGPIIERIYWSAVGSLANHPEELVEEAAYQLKTRSRRVRACLRCSRRMTCLIPRRGWAPVSRRRLRSRRFCGARRRGARLTASPRSRSTHAVTWLAASLHAACKSRGCARDRVT